MLAVPSVAAPVIEVVLPPCRAAQFSRARAFLPTWWLNCFRVGQTRLPLSAPSSGTAGPRRAIASARGEAQQGLWLRGAFAGADRRRRPCAGIAATRGRRKWACRDQAQGGADVLAHVPFGGAGWAMVSVVGEHTPIGFSSPAAALPHIRDGKLRALAVTSKTRSDTLPKVPTMTEAGYPASLGDSWGWRPGSQRNAQACRHAAQPWRSLRKASWRCARALGSNPIGSTPEQFSERIKVEMETWGNVIAAAAIRIN